MATRFDNCEYGPMALRPLLRAHLMPGEEGVGWGVVSRDMSSFDAALLVALALIPAAGAVLSQAVLSRTKRVMILTDARLLILPPDARAADPKRPSATLDAPLHSVFVARTARARAFRILGPGWLRPEAYKLPSAKQGAHRRLAEGLGVLAADSDQVNELLAGDPG